MCNVLGAMKQALRSALYSIFSPFVFIIAASAFETRGRNSWQEGIAGAIGLVIYLGIVQFLLVRSGRKALQPRWPVLAGAAVPVLLAFCIILVFEKPEVVLMQGVPMLAGGAVGIGLGALLAWPHMSAVTNASIGQ